jgi:ribonucleoside-diphosphate reductase alpha chain
MQSPNFEKSIDSMVKALTFVTDHSDIDAVPTIKNGNKKAHTIGLGAMGLHSYFAKHHMVYGSPESIELQIFILCC